jgi:hypothetical protein
MRLRGSGLLVLDVDAEDTSVQADRYYVVENATGGVDLAEGADAMDIAAKTPDAVLGPVLFLCRPPSRDGAASATSELLSL